jgi:seryl-tRNA synthetase
VAPFREAAPDQAEYLLQLTAAGLLIESGVPGVYGRGPVFEDIRLRFDELVSRHVTDEVLSLRFGPVLPRKHLEMVGYLNSFPHLTASIFGFNGSEREAGEMAACAHEHQPWGAFLEQSDLVLTPAACYPVYPAIAARGPLAPGGVTVDAGGSMVFRAEPSGDPARLQVFHQREIVRIGEPEAVAAWRDGWRDRCVRILRGIGLDADFDVATDPFFGRRGRMMATSQREQELKFEVQVQIAGPEPTAVASFNYHQEHFSSVFGLELADGGIAHTACLGFGLERVTLALLRTHGLEPAAWPEAVRRELWA